MFKNQFMQGCRCFAFMFMGLPVLIVALIDLSSSSRLSKHIETLANNNVPSLSGLWKINEGQTQIESSERGLLNLGLKQKGRKVEVDRMDHAWKQIQEGFKQYDETTKAEAEKQDYQIFLKKWDTWKQAQEEFLRLDLQFENQLATSLEGNTDSDARASSVAYKIMAPQAEVNRLPFNAAAALLAVLKVNEDLATDTERVSAADVSKTGFWAFVAILLGSGTAVIFGFFFSNTIAKPWGAKIAGVVNIAQKSSAGDLTSQIPSAKQHDEVGQLENAFYTMNKDLNELINRTRQSGNQITDSADQITTSGRNLEATVAEQVASTNQVTATTHPMAATSRELVKTMEQVAAMAEQTTEAAGNRKDNLQPLNVVMRQLLNATQLISSKLEVMNERANNINRVGTTITVVADQTNLLSLNAALEAERTGEYGIGLAVVAREIRRLADQTAVATLEIEKMIKNMQLAVSIGVVEMEKFQGSVLGSASEVIHINDQIARFKVMV